MRKRAMVGDSRRGGDGGDSQRRTRDAAARSDTADAFIADPSDGPVNVSDDLAETLAEEFVRSATTGEDTGDEVRDQFVTEEIGGPFVESTADEEFADGLDESNPADTIPEPHPRAVGSLVWTPREDDEE